MKINLFFFAAAALLSTNCSAKTDKPDKEVFVESVSLNEKTATLTTIGQTLTLEAVVLPEKATNKRVFWNSDNTDAVTVLDGKLTAVAEGTATVTVTTEEGQKEDQCVVTVDLAAAPVHNIYVAGSMYYAEGEGARATLWTNGTAQKLSESTSVVNSVFVADNGDIYVAGAEFDSNMISVPTLWKNGVAQELPGKPAVIKSVFISGSDVWLAGNQLFGRNGPKAVYWKNGELTTLSNLSSEAISIAVSAAGETCIAGYDTNSKGEAAATLWTNGTAQTLDADYSFANGVACSGSDVYVGGYGHSGGDQIGTVWKNGTATTLSTDFSPVYAIAASGSDVYAAGYVSVDAIRFATLWTNGTATTLGDNESWAYGVCVLDGNSYVVGYAHDAAEMTHATIWINGTATTLSEKNSSASAVFVK